MPFPLAPLADRPHRFGVAVLVVALIITCAVPQVRSGWIHAVSHFISNGFYVAALSAAIAWMLWLAWIARSKRLFWHVAAPLGTETCIMQTVQKVSYHAMHLWPRPSHTDGGFPSGHMAAGTVMAYLLSQRYPRFVVLWYGTAGLVGWSRWEDNAHYPYQVVAGAVLGLICAAVLAPKFAGPAAPLASGAHLPT